MTELIEKDKAVGCVPHFVDEAKDGVVPGYRNAVVAAIKALPAVEIPHDLELDAALRQEYISGQQDTLRAVRECMPEKVGIDGMWQWQDNIRGLSTSPIETREQIVKATLADNRMVLDRLDIAPGGYVGIPKARLEALERCARHVAAAQVAGYTKAVDKQITLAWKAAKEALELQ